MFFKVEVSAETTEQADNILNDLLERKIATGGQVIGTPARFLWKGSVVDMEYFTITSFTVDSHKQAIVDAVEKTSVEEVPMITFTPIEVNDKLARWISETVTGS
jgi:uncharacterized protein involved in tolerance to divalent cations